VDLSKKPIWIEGPHIFRRNGQLYLIAAEGGTSVQHSEVVFKADDVTGPWKPYAHNPILTQRHLNPERKDPVTSVGHAGFTQTPGGEWWSVFLGTRPYKDNLYNTGRETFLMQVHWIDGWPVITRGDERVPYKAPRPDLPAQAAPAIPTYGNFTLRDEFDGVLSDYWLMMRTPRENWYDLKSKPGTIIIKARADSIGGFGQPSYLGRRQQHMNATVTTTMHFVLPGPGDRAGLVALQNDEYYYFFGLQNIDDQMQIVVSKRTGANDPVNGIIVHSKAIDDIPNATIELRIEAHEGRYSFRYRLPHDKWQLLAENLDGTILSTQVAGGFVGATLGIYAYSPNSKSSR